MKTHINKIYENELKLLQDKILLMAQEVKKNITNAMKSLEENNIDLALSVIAHDKYIDNEELAIDEQCISMLAKRQPLGKDLRFIVSILKMVTYFERLGDLAVNIAERVIKLNGAPSDLSIQNLIIISKLLEEMINNTLQAFINKDAKKAYLVIKSDNAIDELYHSTISTYMNNIKEDKIKTDEIFHLLSIAKWLERMGDHCTNLAELIIFMVKGEDIRHKSPTGL